jgi:hypothetical protein
MDIEMLVAHAETKERAKNEPKSKLKTLPFTIIQVRHLKQ